MARVLEVFLRGDTRGGVERRGNSIVYGDEIVGGFVGGCRLLLNRALLSRALLSLARVWVGKVQKPLWLQQHIIGNGLQAVQGMNFKQALPQSCNPRGKGAVYSMAVRAEVSETKTNPSGCCSSDSPLLQMDSALSWTRRL